MERTQRQDFHLWKDCVKLPSRNKLLVAAEIQCLLKWYWCKKNCDHGGNKGLVVAKRSGSSSSVFVVEITDREVCEKTRKHTLYSFTQYTNYFHERISNNFVSEVET